MGTTEGGAEGRPPTPEQAQVSREGRETEEGARKKRGDTRVQSSEGSEDQEKRSRMTGEGISGDGVIVKVPGLR